MCGITGVVCPDNTRRDLESTVRAMTETLAHRGPDDSGVWTDPRMGVGLGQRRLSIIDLSPLGHQPMLSSDERYAIVFNGEVYNFRALRAELETLGHGFNGQSDTEVLLAAIAQWGVEHAVQRCIGMFAFAVWDTRERVLCLVRDRLGIKPLYVGLAGRDLVFGSELKALTAHPDFDGSLDLDALALYFRHNYIPAPHTIYKAAKKILPGTIARYKLDGNGIDFLGETIYWSVRGTWDAGQAAPFAGSEAEAADQLEALLSDAVALRMIADVPLGAFLSGGIDSSLVAALMQRQSTRPVKTYTIGFEEQTHNEATFASAVAAHLGTDHTSITCAPRDLLKVVPIIPEHWDEPFSDSSLIPTYLVSALARQHVTVCLSGDGGDELFAGYGRYAYTLKLDRLRRTLAPARKILHYSAALAPTGSRLASRLASLASADFRAFYRSLNSHHKQPDSLVIEGREPETALNATADDWQTLGGPTRAMQYWDLVTYLPDDILTKVDRASMAVSLEARVPILDHRVVEFAARLPESMQTPPPNGKRILREVLYRHVPRELVDRPKMGFGVPIAHWLRHELRDWAGDLLSEKTLREQGLLDVPQVQRLWTEHQSGTMDRAYYLWDVLMLQAWLATR